MQIDTSDRRSRVVAVLGPTNTGKTHLAMERMLGHATGMIGFPLRLLARENYDRAVLAKGRGQVALITGEEKIVPPGARYFLCTAESMPLDRRVAFVGIDEIQMCADPDRGHVFTDRLLGARGTDETMLMGSDVIKPLLKHLVPEAEFVSRPRLSTLTYSGERKTTRLKPRTAVVAFSAADVYGLAELLRRQRGGAAVVLGALSPRTRNAQVAMYQEGEVDYLVATDAIGMGLNMDVDHVAFAATAKFDGRVRRRLTAAELAQTAGRAGRHMNDGTFGTTGGATGGTPGGIGPLDADVVARIENHHFEPLRALFWRNPALDFSSLAGLRRSLARPPAAPGLMKAREADDELALGHLAGEPEIAGLADGPARVALLWEVCRIPDFGGVMSDAHARLLASVYRHLMGPDGRLPTDWLAAQVARLDRTNGDIETLAGRIASIRTWTYVSYHADWVSDAGHWQERTRGLEDKLSDALHRGLTQRFVDPRTAVLVSRIKELDRLLAAVDAGGDVTVEGHFVGRLEGFRFQPDESGDGAAAKAVTGAAALALRGEIAARLGRLEKDPDERFELVPDDSGWRRRIEWRGEAVAGLAAGSGPLKPVVEPLASGLLEAPARDRLRRRLQSWLAGRVEDALGPLFGASGAALTGAARGLVFQLAQALGSLDRVAVADQIEALGPAGRKSLRRLGVTIGRHHVFMPGLLKPAAVHMRGLLWTVWSGNRQVPAPPAPGRVSVPVSGDAPPGFFEALGYRPLGTLAVRVDMVERLAAKAWSLSRKGAFTAGPELMSLAGSGPGEMAEILAGLGYRGKEDASGVVRYRWSARLAGKPKPAAGKTRERRKAGAKPRSKVGEGAEADSPFAKLRDLAVAPGEGRKAKAPGEGRKAKAPGEGRQENAR